MGKSFLSEDDLKNFKDRYNETVKLGRQMGVPFVPYEQIGVHNPIVIMTAISVESLEQSSKRLEQTAKILNRLTAWLILLTALLTILTGISVWKLLSP